MGMISVEVTTVCARCGRTLEFKAAMRTGGEVLRVEPCTDCLDTAENVGYTRCEQDNGL